MSRGLKFGLYGAALLIGGTLALSRINTNKDPLSLEDKSLLTSYTEKALEKLPDNPITSVLCQAKNKISTDYGKENYRTLRGATFSILEGLGYVQSELDSDHSDCGDIGKLNGKTISVWKTLLKKNPRENVAVTMCRTFHSDHNYDDFIYWIELHFERNVPGFGSPRIHRIVIKEKYNSEKAIMDRGVSDFESELPEILKELSD